ncbi:MAG: ComF family protein [Pseudomonadota bacterium]
MPVLQKNITKIVDFVLPPRCLMTGEIVDKQGMITPESWAQLNFIAAPFCDSCGIPFDFDIAGSETEAGQKCATCLKKAPEYDQARAALIYDDFSRNLILPFKHGDKTHFVLGFLPWLKQAGGELIDQADLIMPVPLHRLRLFQRRYNQAGIIASYLGRQIQKPYVLDGLVRTRLTPTQGYLKAKERARNVRRAFSVNPKKIENIRGKNILLIDDVLTTGATVNECAKTLKQAGAKTVNVLTVARVVRK